MSEESVKKKRRESGLVFVWLVVAILILSTLFVSNYFGYRKYYLLSLLLIVYSMIPFFLSYEKRKPQAREVVTLAVMCAVAVASRAAFLMLPHFKPMTGIIMITGISFGPEAGFLTGALSGFVSNFIFGQGPWTPWQMFAFGVAGFLAGILSKTGFLTGEKPLRAAVFGGLSVVIIVGPLLDTCTLFTMAAEINSSSAAGIYLSGLPVNLVHGLATFLTVLLLCRPITEKLDRIRVKYGMMSDN